MAQRRTLLLVVLATLLFYLGIIALSIRHYGYNLSSLVDVGTGVTHGALDPATTHLLGHHVVIFRHSDGYDGQAFYLVAGDPLLRQRAFRDPFRYQRIGYPVLIAAVSGGERELRPLAMVSINVVAALAVAYLAGLIILLYGTGGSPSSLWWALGCAANPSLMIGVGGDLAEPLTMALSLAALLLYLRRHVWPAALVLAAAMLTREVAILFIVALLLTEARGRRWRNALTLTLAVVPFVAWQAVLIRVLRGVGLQGTRNNFDLPLRGLGAVIAAARHASWRSALVHQGSVLALAILVVATLVVAAVYLRRHDDAVLGSIVIHAAAALCAGSFIWLGYASAARVFGGLYPLTIFAFTHYRTRTFALLAWTIVAFTIFTFFRLIAVSPVLPYYLTP